MESVGRGIESEVVDAGVGRSKYGARSSYSESAMTGLFTVASHQVYRVLVYSARVIALRSETCEIGTVFIVRHGLTLRTELNPCQANTCLPSKAPSGFDLDFHTPLTVDIIISNGSSHGQKPGCRSAEV